MRAVCLLLVLSLIGVSTFWHFTPTTKADIYNNQIIIKLRAGTLIEPIASRFGLTIVDRLDAQKEYLLSVPLGLNLNLLFFLLSNTLGIENAGPNTIAYGLGQPSGFTGDRPIVLDSNPARYQTQQLNSFLQTDIIRGYSQGQGVKIAVIDTGVDLLHPAINQQIASGGYDYVDRDGVPYDEPGGTHTGHGTFVSGLILLLAPKAEILPIRVLATDGTGDAFHISAAIYRAADQNAKVINLSLGTDHDTGMLQRAVTYAQSKGCVVTAAMGNENANATNISPANYPNVLAVAATDFSDQKSVFSNYGNSVSLTAPGVDLVSAFPGGFYATWSGTSFSTPLASAQAALLFSKGKNRDTVTSVMKASAVRINQPSYSLGYGRINPLAALSQY
jgi:subtilisin family serine protease